MLTREDISLQGQTIDDNDGVVADARYKYKYNE